MKLRNKKMRFSKYVILFMLLFLLLFTALMVYMFWIYQSVPGELIMAVFAFAAAEGGCLALIKKWEG